MHHPSLWVCLLFVCLPRRALYLPVQLLLHHTLIIQSHAHKLPHCMMKSSRLAAWEIQVLFSTLPDDTNSISAKKIIILCVLISGQYERRSMLIAAAGMLALSFIPSKPALSREVPKNYKVFVDKADGYSYVYPSDWRDFDFRAHDSAFKDRYLQLQNVRLSFLPTDKQDIHDLGPMEDVVRDLVNNIYAAPNQVTDIKEIQERSDNRKNYYTVEYQLTSPNFAVSHFTTIAIANGRFYTLTVGANERRWKRFRNKLKVVADSFEVFDI